MGHVRRNGLAAAVLLAAVATIGTAIGTAHGQDEERAGESVILLVAAEPGSLSIINRGSAPVAIARAIAVERSQGGVWRRVDTEFNAVSQCPSATRRSDAGPVRLARGQRIDVVPWRGFSCSGQCNKICRRNIYWGPGDFRHVVTRLAGGRRVVGPVFRMPSRPPARVAPAGGFRLRSGGGS